MWRFNKDRHLGRKRLYEGEGNLRRSHYILVCCVIITTAVYGQEYSAPHFMVEGGPYAIGLKVVDQYDRERIFKPHIHEGAKAVPGERTRPLQTLVWYPAQKISRHAMTVGDYLALTKTETSFGAPGGYIHEQRMGMVSAICGWQCHARSTRRACRSWALSGGHLFSQFEGRLVLRRADAFEPPDRVKQLRRVIEPLIRHIRIEDLLREVDVRCGFTREFRPLPGYESRLNPLVPVLQVAITARAANLGIVMMSNSTDGVSVEALREATHCFLRESTLKAANTRPINYHYTYTMSGVWGSRNLSSSDGQRFGIQRSSLLAAFYPRYFGYYDRAVSIYTHTSDQFSVFSTQVISCSPREALYVLDGLLENDTVLRLREHTTDTHGYTEQLFGLCFLLGFSFMPRIKDLADQQLYIRVCSIDDPG